MRKKVVATIATAALLGTVAVIMLASSSPAITTAQTIWVKEVNGRDKMIDLNGRGPSPGDQIVFRADLVNRSGNRVGFDIGQCTLNFNNQAYCSATFNLVGRGQIIGEGRVSPTAPGGVFAITGGTGNFQNARGEVHLRFYVDLLAKFAFHLVP